MRDYVRKVVGWLLNILLEQFLSDPSDNLSQPIWSIPTLYSIIHCPHTPELEQYFTVTVTIENYSYHLTDIHTALS